MLARWRLPQRNLSHQQGHEGSEMALVGIVVTSTASTMLSS